MERGRLCSVPSVAPVPSSPTRLPVNRRRRKCTFSVLTCLVFTVLHVNVQTVRSIKSHSLRPDSARRRPSPSKQQTQASSTDEGSSNSNSSGNSNSNSNSSNYLIHRRKKAFRFAQLLPASWTFLSQRRKTLLPLASTTESESATSADAAADSSETQSQPQYREPQSQTQSSSSTKTSTSVHLQLRELADGTTSNPEDGTEQVPQLPSNSNTNGNGNTNTNNNGNSSTNTTKHTTVKIHTFHDKSTGHTWKALNTHKSKFYAFLKHQNCTSLISKADIVTSRISLSDKEEEDEHCHNQQLRQEWRVLWKKRQLVTDRTELLAVYPSDKAATLTAASTDVNGSDNEKKADVAAKHKRGGFADLLYLYTERLVSIIRDEQVEANQTLNIPASYPTEQQQQQQNTDDESMLMDWLRGTYGKDLTEQLRAGNLGLLNEKEQLGHLKHFLEWFRLQFPYYYDRCGTCGASMKEDNASRPAPPVDSHGSDDGEDHNDSRDDQEEQDEHQTFVGYIYPDEVELQGKASRTEIYHCHKCESFTRFPRYNSVTHVIENQRGRCGEYSMLLYRILRALDHEARWVVDWADHVWAEVELALGDGTSTTGSLSTTSSRRWVHLDPCEAAVDENFIYQGWGKKQTYILGFYAPPQRGTSTNGSVGSSDPLDLSETTTTTTTPIIEDITAQYTTDSWEEICKRRDESEDEIRVSMAKAIGDLAPKLRNFGEDRH